jgi:hypothetical protein
MKNASVLTPAIAPLTTGSAVLLLRMRKTKTASVVPAGRRRKLSWGYHRGVRVARIFPENHTSRFSPSPTEFRGALVRNSLRACRIWPAAKGDGSEHANAPSDAGPASPRTHHSDSSGPQALPPPPLAAASAKSASYAVLFSPPAGRRLFAPPAGEENDVAPIHCTAFREDAPTTGVSDLMNSCCNGEVLCYRRRIAGA